mmetsp:Transcript_5657/g.19249  ORF Transcript_5657/g.19249 Transcript_5657/m.19249 type:complete len:357 (-) Transcript_5657:266-1336(-)
MRPGHAKLAQLVVTVRLLELGGRGHDPRASGRDGLPERLAGEHKDIHGRSGVRGGQPHAARPGGRARRQVGEVVRAHAVATHVGGPLADIEHAIVAWWQGELHGGAPRGGLQAYSADERARAHGASRRRFVVQGARDDVHGGPWEGLGARRREAVHHGVRLLGGAGQVEPDLVELRAGLTVRPPHLLVEHTLPRGQPLHLAIAVALLDADAVPVRQAAGEGHSHRLKAGVRVRREALGQEQVEQGPDGVPGGEAMPVVDVEDKGVRVLALEGHGRHAPAKRALRVGRQFAEARHVHGGAHQAVGHGPDGQARRAQDPSHTPWGSVHAHAGNDDETRERARRHHGWPRKAQVRARQK